MESASQRVVAEKVGFYRQSSVADTYDLKRFGGASGARVNQRELALVHDLLPARGKVLDLGCGTGRVSRSLVASGREVIMIDASEAMLGRATGAAEAPAVLGDAFSLPFAAESFDAVVALRVVFHFSQFDALLDSVVPLLRPGGRFIFDTYRWTPRALLAVASRSWGGKVYTHSPSTVASSARRAGLRIAAGEPCFLFSPYLYRLLPLPVVRGLEQIERWVPPAGRARIFWALEKAALEDVTLASGGRREQLQKERGEWVTQSTLSGGKG